MDELRLLVRSIIERLLGLLSNERFARDMSAVTLVIATLAYTGSESMVQLQAKYELSASVKL